MGKLLAILFVPVMLASGMTVSIDHHYCGGRLAQTKLSVSGKLASCGMETQERNFSDQLSFGNKCCEDQLTRYVISAKYIPEYFDFSYTPENKNLPAAHEVNPLSGYSDNYGLSFPEFPPGNKFRSSVSLFRICILRT